PTVSFASTSKVSVVPWQAVSVSGTPIGFARYVSDTCPLAVQPVLSAKLYVNATVPTKLGLGTNVRHLFAHGCVPAPQGWFKLNVPWLAGGGLGTVNELQSGVAAGMIVCPPTINALAKVSLASTSKLTVVPWQAVSV